LLCMHNTILVIVAHDVSVDVDWLYVNSAEASTEECATTQAV